ncbi:hypothetical protein TD95_001100 [Thielaviopsis punctulata]|uniref:ATP-dependent RNA helicase ROK1 n=1 Tax=Thielaviopsis punctulata TaxID=72032 RepID=A0A0F4ZKC8_9PEZI|nr:hypothetical protein TD95_001100 [Thielaviopsis punctulata]
MDILKVLSRGSKKPSKTAIAKNGTVAVLKLPSAGTEAKPQLFHDEVGVSRKRKRTTDETSSKTKKTQACTTSNEGEDDLPEVDFFAAKIDDDDDDDGNANADADGGDSVMRDADTEESEDESEKRERMSEEECKALLRSHRLKITLLSKGPEKTAADDEDEQDGKNNKKDKKKKKKEKKSKKEDEEKEEAAKSKKEDKKMLFPEPLTSFDDLRTNYRISRRLAENIKDQAYKLPTEIQMAALPLLVDAQKALSETDRAEIGASNDRVDVLAVAPTGSGKTISFLIPAINNILSRRAKMSEQERTDMGHELEAVVLAPTRELAHQIVNEARKLAKDTGLRVVLMKKGMNIAAEKGVSLDEDEEDDDEEEDDDDDDDNNNNNNNKDDTEKQRPLTPVDILVTTPMPLLNYLTKASSSPDTPMVLPTVRSLILDEADVLLDQLFREQTTAVWKTCTHPALHHSLWSATMDSTIEALVTSLLAARSAQPAPLVRLVVGLKNTAVPNIKHKLLFTGSESGKIYAIRQLLRPGTRSDDTLSIRPPFIVFTQSIERAAALAEELRYDIPLEAGGSARIAALHSGLTDAQRAGIMRQFRAGEIWILITTDVLARGVDFAGVNGVVNYDIPGSSAVYIHRAGRTGRAGREGGIAVTLWTKDDIPYVKVIANVIAASDKQAGRTGTDLGVPESLLASLPAVSKQDKKKLRERGVAARRSGGASAKITTKSGWERQRDHNRQAAVDHSKKRKKEEKRQKREQREKGGEEWGGIEG